MVFKKTERKIKKRMVNGQNSTIACEKKEIRELIEKSPVANMHIVTNFPDG